MELKFEQKPISLLHIIMLAVVLWGGEYIRRELWDPDEARYAYVAREMSLSGNWAVPHRNEEAYSHKPPLMFWMINAFSLFNSGHINHVTARLPSLVGMIMCLWALARLAQRWDGNRTSWRAVITLVTMYLIWHEGGWGRTDALLLGFEMMALYFLFTNDDRPSFWRPFAAYSCMGLAILTKGPVGFIIPWGAYFFALLASDRRALRKWHWLWGPLVALLFPALWLGCAWSAGAPEQYFREILISQHTGRISGERGHSQSLFYYLIYYPVSLLPWAVFVPAIFMSMRKAAAETQSLWRAITWRRMVAWILFVVIFFSIPGGKRHIYVLLAFPPAAMMIASAWDILDNRAGRISAKVAIALLMLLATAAVAAGCLVSVPFEKLLLAPFVILMVVGSLFLALKLKAKGVNAEWLYSFAAIVLVMQMYVGAFIYPAFNSVKVPVAFSKMVKQELTPEERLIYFRMNGEIISYHCERIANVFYNDADLISAMQSRKKGIFVAEEYFWNMLNPETKAMLSTNTFNVGSKSFVWARFSM